MKLIWRLCIGAFAFDTERAGRAWRDRTANRLFYLSRKSSEPPC